MREPLDFTLAHGDRLHRLQRRVGLITGDGYGLGRRILLVLLVAWLPLVIWAAMAGRLQPPGADEPLLHHLGIHVRCLIAIPLLLLAEPVVDGRLRQVVAYFRRAGLVGEAARAPFAELIATAGRARDSVPVLLVLAGGSVLLGLSEALSGAAHEVRWAAAEPPTLGFGGWWYLLVTRPLFTFLLAHWLWRGLVLFRLFRGVARLPLELVPTHADRAMGLGFLMELTPAAAPITLALSAVVSARLAHEGLWHDAQVADMFPVLGTLIILLTVAVVSPLLAFTARLVRARREALSAYGALVARHGLLVDRRWIREEPVADTPLLDAPELGPLVDIHATHTSVAASRPLLIGPQTLLQAALPPILPLLPLLAIDFPVAEILRRLLGLLL